MIEMHIFMLQQVSIISVCLGDQLQLRPGRVRTERVHQESGLQRDHALSEPLLLHQRHPRVGLRTLRVHRDHPRSADHFGPDTA